MRVYEQENAYLLLHRVLKCTWLRTEQKLLNCFCFHLICLCFARKRGRRIQKRTSSKWTPFTLARKWVQAYTQHQHVTLVFPNRTIKLCGYVLKLREKQSDSWSLLLQDNKMRQFIHNSVNHCKVAIAILFSFFSIVDVPFFCCILFRFK